MSECKACQDRGQTWKGDLPKCGFIHGAFDGEWCWNCATANQIRELCERENDHRIHHQCPDNQHYATISLLETDILPQVAPHGYLNAQPVCLWVGWYKNRGRTEAMWLMFEELPPRAPTEEECLKILKHYTV